MFVEQPLGVSQVREFPSLTDGNGFEVVERGNSRRDVQIVQILCSPRSVEKANPLAQRPDHDPPIPPPRVVGVGQQRDFGSVGDAGRDLDGPDIFSPVEAKNRRVGVGLARRQKIRFTLGDDDPPDNRLAPKDSQPRRVGKYPRLTGPVGRRPDAQRRGTSFRR